MAKPGPRGALNLEFSEQVEFFRKKLNLPTARWDDIRRAAHDTSFVVTGAMKADLLSDLNQAVEKAIAKGTGLKAFRKDFRKIVAERGWHGWTGEGTKAGEAWRTRVIWETNLATSYAAGRHAQLTDPDLLARRPYWKYVHADGVMNPRPQHLAWNGLVLRHDHPFWQTHSPPNGWGCHCRIVAVRAPTEGDPTEPPAGWNQRDAKGNLPGIDKNWDYAPGASVSNDIRRIVEEKAAKLPDQLALDFGKEMAKAGVLHAQPPKPPATLDEFIAAGKEITDALPTKPEELYPALMKRLEDEAGIGLAAAIASKGKGADLVKGASRRYPKAWVEAANDFGPLHTKLDRAGRGGYIVIDNSKYPLGSKVRVLSFGVVTVEKNAGYILVRDLPNAIHEYAHRLQNVHPKLQKLFKELHDKRTAGDALESLKKLEPFSTYRKDERTRRDHYISNYWGKDYGGEPLEVMAMGFQTVLAGHKWKGGKFFNDLYNKDREMFDFVVGLLFHWRP
jgi:hypothetical protein